MLEQHGVGRNWVTDELKSPFARGINFQIGVLDLGPILSALGDAETKWYRVSDSEEAGVRQFLAADPDGYLIRFQSSLGRRVISM